MCYWLTKINIVLVRLTRYKYNIMNNVQKLTLWAIIIAITSSLATYSWNSKSIAEMVEEHNRQVLENCLTKARIKKTAKEILEYASNCNKDILTNISAPRSVETITWTANTTPLSSVPLWLQLIPSANASVPDAVENGKSQAQATQLSIQHQSVENVVKSNIRTPKQIYEQVKHLGYREAPAISLISTCKVSSSDVQKCILVWLVLMYNEAGNQQNSKACTYRNNCFWINAGKKVYSSLEEGMENWVQKYNKYWYKAESASFFYSSSGKVSPSRYCTSESSSNSTIWCPRWLSIATDKWNKLKNIIY